MSDPLSTAELKNIFSREFDVEAFRRHLASHGDLAKPSKFNVTFSEPKWYTEEQQSLGQVVVQLPEPDPDGGPVVLEGFEIVGGKIPPWEELTFQCEAAELPGYEVDVLESKIGGASWWLPASPKFSTLTLTFICAQDMWEKRLMDDWMGEVFPSFANRLQSGDTRASGLGSYRLPMLRYRDDYAVTIYISQKIEQGRADAYYEKSEGSFDEILPYGSVKPAKMRYNLGFAEKPIDPANYTIIVQDAFPISVAALPLNWGDTEGIHRLQVTFRYTRWLRINDELADEVTEQFKKTIPLALKTLEDNPNANAAIYYYDGPGTKNKYFPKDVDVLAYRENQYAQGLRTEDTLVPSYIQKKYGIKSDPSTNVSAAAKKQGVVSPSDPSTSIKTNLGPL